MNRETLLRRLSEARPIFRALVYVALAVAAFHFLGFRVNLTSSLPIGVYKEMRNGGPLGVGDLASVCLDRVAVPLEQRKLFRAGLCPNLTRPLLKCIVAERGDLVEPTTSGLRIHGELSYSWSLPEGPFPLAEPQRLTGAQVWLWAPHPHSWDSRYFGPQEPLRMKRVVPVWPRQPELCSIGA